MQKKFRQRWKTFVKTNDGRNLWFLHKQGYKFCEYLEDLTYEQEAFLILANNSCAALTFALTTEYALLYNTLVKYSC